MIRRAHIRENGKEQPLMEHLLNVAELTKEYAQKMSCPNLGYLTGLLHDMGKGTKAFDDYIVLVSRGEHWNEGKYNHSSAGAKYLMELVSGSATQMYEQLTLQLICEAIICHHSGLCDNYSDFGEDKYKRRIYTEKEIFYKEAVRYFQETTAKEQDIRNMFYKAAQEVKKWLDCKFGKCEEVSEIYYACGLFMKALFSCLVDADRYDTASFMDGQELKAQDDNQNIWKEFSAKLDNNIKLFPQTSALSSARIKISEQCRQSAELESGIYTLSCPTGSGKTYSSMRFALHHAVKWEKKQIFYIIPFMAVIDQNAKAIRDILGEKIDSRRIVELHSNIVQDNENGDYKLLTERMDAPIVLTTMVRFLNTFFAGGTQSVRPIHQFQNAVIIFDEIQTLPIRCVRMFNGLLNFLAEVCSSTCILCTATQPLLNRPYEEVKPIRLSKQKSLVVIDKSVKNVFERVILQDARRERGYSVIELVRFVIEKAEKEGNCLVVMNTKTSALKLFQEIQGRNSSFKLVFLSTKLCPAHRKEVVQDIIKTLKTERMIVVSTQLIEAGIDLSFRCAVRSIAGLDSVVQTAGRCNRNGECEKKYAYIVNPDFENLSHLQDIKIGGECTNQILNEYKATPETFDMDLFSDKAIERYFELYLYKQRGKMSYSRGKEHNGSSLFDLLARNEGQRKAAVQEQKGKYVDYILGQAFETAGREFDAINKIGKSVLVSYKESKIIIADLESSDGIWNKRVLLQKAQQYAVNLTEQEIKQLRGAVRFNEAIGVYILNDLYYDSVMGVTGETSPGNIFCGI